MSHRQLWMIRSVCIAIFLLCFSGIAGAQLFDMRIGLVAPGVGWVVQNQGTQPNPNNHLYWTANDGENWTDITPQDPASSQIAGVFFLDASRGWVLLALKREPKKGNQELVDFVTDIRGFDLASTTDGGANWAIKPLSSLPEGVGWAAAAQIFFLDAAHGWMDIESPVPHWGGEGVLLATTDGGNTWKEIVEVNGGGGYGAIRFTDPQNGWIAGGPGDQYLYATNDGGRHWREVAVPAPSPISGHFENVAALYALPELKDSKHGLLPVMYSGPGESGEAVSILALFSTDDGGRTWRAESWADLDQATDIPVVAVVDSTAVAPKRLDNEPPTLLKLGLGGKLGKMRASESPEVPSGAALLGLTFRDAAHGWASSSDGRLLSTADGGMAWKDVTPGRKKISMQVPSTTVPSGSSSGTLLQSSPLASLASGCARGINNNDQITGSLAPNSVFEHEGSYITIAVPGASSATQLWSLNDFTLNSVSTAKVALVGYYFAGGAGHGFLATSQ